MENNTYPIDVLTNRLYSDLSRMRNNKKFTIDIPSVTSANRRTFVANYRTICEQLKRDEEDIKTYFKTELRTDITIDQKGVMIITAMLKQNNIQKIFDNYIKQYVACDECHGCDTTLVKENRILYIKCNNCLCKKAKIN